MEKLKKYQHTNNKRGVGLFYSVTLEQFLIIMEINWVAVGWIIDMILNGVVWLIIAAFSLVLIDVTDKWTRKVIKLMGKADDLIRIFVENSFEWILKKNLKILSSIILLIIFGILAQLGIIPKLIT